MPQTGRPLAKSQEQKEFHGRALWGFLLLSPTPGPGPGWSLQCSPVCAAGAAAQGPRGPSHAERDHFQSQGRLAQQCSWLARVPGPGASTPRPGVPAGKRHVRGQQPAWGSRAGGLCHLPKTEDGKPDSVALGQPGTQPHAWGENRSLWGWRRETWWRGGVGTNTCRCKREEQRPLGDGVAARPGHRPERQAAESWQGKRMTQWTFLGSPACPPTPTPLPTLSHTGPLREPSPGGGGVGCFPRHKANRPSKYARPGCGQLALGSASGPATPTPAGSQHAPPGQRG